VRMPWPRYLLLSGAANLGISLVYAAVGAYAMTAGSFLWAFLAALALPGAALWWAGRPR